MYILRRSRLFVSSIFTAIHFILCGKTWLENQIYKKIDDLGDEQLSVLEFNVESILLSSRYGRYNCSLWYCCRPNEMFKMVQCFVIRLFRLIQCRGESF